MFLAVRYFALCGYMAMSSLIFGNFTPNVCKNLNLAKEILMMSEELSVGCMLALRIFALYSFKKRVITIVIAAAMIGLSVAATRTERRTIGEQYLTTFNSSKTSELRSLSTMYSAFSAALIGFPQIYTRDTDSFLLSSSTP
ncbi:hypothetical protein C8J57DRAFT_1473629 [Mycena rebaudengoi]|nr:hypothetical protein C8J57DRAFT_1473629 [Mycena rebaudengoi]